MDIGVTAALIGGGTALVASTVSPWVVETLRSRSRANLRTAIKEEIDLLTSVRTGFIDAAEQAEKLEKLVTDQIRELVAREQAAAARRTRLAEVFLNVSFSLLMGGVTLAFTWLPFGKGLREYSAMDWTAVVVSALGFVAAAILFAARFTAPVKLLMAPAPAQAEEENAAVLEEGHEG